jgi:hypothetical protein
MADEAGRAEYLAGCRICQNRTARQAGAGGDFLSGVFVYFALIVISASYKSMLFPEQLYA